MATKFTTGTLVKFTRECCDDLEAILDKPGSFHLRDESFEVLRQEDYQRWTVIKVESGERRVRTTNVERARGE